MINPLLFTLAVLGMAVVVTVPVIGAFVLIHRYTYRPAAFWVWLAGSLVYVSVTAAVLAEGAGLAS